jgi:DNA-damage-inducible protein D
VHEEVGRKVRQTIQELGGTMPEDLPTPEQSIQQVREHEQRRLKQGPQLSLFEPPEE